MKFMNCTTCQRVVKINNTGICLSCQKGFPGVDGEDVYKPHEIDTEIKQLERDIDAELERLKAIQDKINQLEKE